MIKIIILYDIINPSRPKLFYAHQTPLILPHTTLIIAEKGSKT